MLTIFKKFFGKSEKKPAAPAAAPTPQQTQYESAIQIAKVEVAKLSLKAIAAKFPEEVSALLNQAPDEGATVALPIQTIVKQLPSGTVRMSLASLHRQAPAGLFKPLPPGDKRMVEVPLAEVFKHVKPGTLKRRNDQRAVVIEHDEDLAGPLFNNASAPKETQPADADEAGESIDEAAPAATGMRTVAPPSGLELSGAKKAPKAAAAKSAAPSSEPCLTFPLAQLTAGWPDEILAVLGTLPPGTTVNVPHQRVAPGLARGRIACTWSDFRAWLTPPPKKLAISDDANLVLPLKVLAPAFLAASKPNPAQRKSITVDETIPALFSGGKPSTPAPADSDPVPPAAGKAPEPAPASSPEAPAGPEATAPEAAAPAANIPAAEPITLKLAPPQPEPVVTPAEASAPVESPAPAPAPKQEPAAPAASKPEPSPASPAPTLGDVLGEPGKDKWTPAELVSRVAKLDGVAGAVVALQEGFPVAHSLPSEVNPETVAAFLPQIFTRLNQYSGEMKLGEVDDLLFTTRGAHCLIYRLGTVYFAVLGHPGSPLPWNELRLVAAELSRQVTK